MLVFALFLSAGSLFAQCVPVSATLAASGDDVTTVWFNGSLVGTFNYVSKGTGTQPTTMTLTPAQLALINNTGGVNCLAVQTQNTICCETLVSFVLDITCSNGQHSYLTSDSIPSTLSFHWDPNANNPPPVNGGLPWTDPNYVPPPGYFTNTPAPVCLNEFFWAKRIWNPITGQQACALAPSQAPQNIPAPADMYFRDCGPITMVNPPAAPNLTITKTAMGPISQINSGMPVTYQIQVCNTGGPIASPVTVADNKPTGFSYYGPWSPAPPQGPYGDPNFIFSEGFPGAPLSGGSACTVLTYELIDYSVNSSDYCQTRTNSVSILGYGAAATAAVTMYCPPNTNTFTPTNTYTPTPTWTNTPVPFTRTFTPTFTNTSTYTSTFTWTNTFPPGTNTPTNTYTPTPTYTFTPTWTVTQTWTPLPGCRLPQGADAPAFAFFQPPGSGCGNGIVLSSGCSMSWAGRDCRLSLGSKKVLAVKARSNPAEARRVREEIALIFQEKVHARSI